MKLPPFKYEAPTSVADAVALLGTGNAKLLSGGQSLMPILAFRLAAPDLLVDLKRIPGLDRITIDDKGVCLGARVRWCDIELDERLKIAHPLLASAISHVAHYQIRNRGTVGGSLAHGDPASEMPGIAVCCDAVITAVGPNGARKIAAGDFYVGPLQTVLADNEVLTEVLLPAWPVARRWGFQEFARRRGDFALAGIAAYYDLDSAGRVVNAHVSVIGATDRPRRLGAAEAALNGAALGEAPIAKAAAAASAEVEPNSDIHAPADYRRALVGTLLERALQSSVR